MRAFTTNKCDWWYIQINLKKLAKRISGSRSHIQSATILSRCSASSSAYVFVDATSCTTKKMFNALSNLWWESIRNQETCPPPLPASPSPWTTVPLFRPPPHSLFPSFIPIVVPISDLFCTFFLQIFENCLDFSCLLQLICAKTIWYAITVIFWVSYWTYIKVVWEIMNVKLQLFATIIWNVEREAGTTAHGWCHRCGREQTWWKREFYTYIMEGACGIKFINNVKNVGWE